MGLVGETRELRAPGGDTPAFPVATSHAQGRRAWGAKLCCLISPRQALMDDGGTQQAHVGSSAHAHMQHTRTCVRVLGHGPGQHHAKAGVCQLPPSPPLCPPLCPPGLLCFGTHCRESPGGRRAAGAGPYLSRAAGPSAEAQLQSACCGPLPRAKVTW